MPNYDTGFDFVRWRLLKEWLNRRADFPSFLTTTGLTSEIKLFRDAGGGWGAIRLKTQGNLRKLGLWTRTEKLTQPQS